MSMTREELDALVAALPGGPDAYNERVAGYLKQIGVEFRVELVGNDCAKWCEQYGQPGAGEFPRKNKHIHGKHYLATFRRPVTSTEQSTKAFTVDFWNSYHDEEFNWLIDQSKSMSYGISVHMERLLKSHRLELRPGGWGFKSHKYSTEDGKVEWKPPRPKLPTSYHVISCLEKDEPDTDFERWAREFGYDPDSRRAEATWKAVLEQWNRVREFFTPDELEVLREIGQ